MRVPSQLKTFGHSLVGIALALTVLYFSLNWLRQHGPTFIQGPAAAVGNTVSGQRFNF